VIGTDSIGSCKSNYHTIKTTTARAPTTLKSEGELTSLSGADKRKVKDNREKW
jgi:hypothetical protein